MYGKERSAAVNFPMTVKVQTKKIQISAATNPKADSDNRLSKPKIKLEYQLLPPETLEWPHSSKACPL